MGVVLNKMFKLTLLLVVSLLFACSFAQQCASFVTLSEGDWSDEGSLAYDNTTTLVTATPCYNFTLTEFNFTSNLLQVEINSDDNVTLSLIFYNSEGTALVGTNGTAAACFGGGVASPFADGVNYTVQVIVSSGDGAASNGYTYKVQYEVNDDAEQTASNCGYDISSGSNVWIWVIVAIFVVVIIAIIIGAAVTFVYIKKKKSAPAFYEDN